MRYVEIRIVSGAVRAQDGRQVLSIAASILRRIRHFASAPPRGSLKVVPGLTEKPAATDAGAVRTARRTLATMAKMPTAEIRAAENFKVRSPPDT
jgi:hypothetical protein